MTTDASSLDVSRLRGYLMKEKQMKHAKSGTSELLSTRGSVRRWFVVEPVANVLEGNNNSSSNEFALCYYKTMASQEPIGWYFLSEFEEIDEDTFLRQIILRHPCRTFRLQAEVMDEHRMWIHGLSTLCASRAKVLTLDVILF